MIRRLLARLFRFGTVERRAAEIDAEVSRVRQQIVEAWERAQEQALAVEATKRALRDWWA